MGFIKSSHQRRHRALSSATTSAKLSAGKAPAPATAGPAGAIPLQSPQFLQRSFPRNSALAELAGIVPVCCRWSFQNLILASGTDNEFILWLYAYFACHIPASTRELFSEPWSYSCLEEFALEKCIFLILGNEREKSSSVNNSPAFSGAENNSNIDQLHLNPKCF